MEKLKNFFRKLKPNRAVYITALTLLVSLAVIIAITVAANRSKRPHVDDTTTTPRPPISTPSTADTTTTRPKLDKPPVSDSSTSTEKPASVDTPLVLALPVSGALSAQHSESELVWSDTMRDYRVHLGVDIATEAGAPVHAAADGVVAQVFEDVKMGYCISLKHGDDTYTIYRNLSETPAQGIVAGAAVKAGQLIGSVGNSAMVEIGEDPHLHLEMTVAGAYVDPLEYFDEATIASLNIDEKYES